MVYVDIELVGLGLDGVDLDDELAQRLGLAVVRQLDHQVLHGAAGVGHLVGDDDGVGMDALDVGEVDALHDALDTVEHGVERAAHQIQVLALKRGDKGALTCGTSRR